MDAGIPALKTELTKGDAFKAMCSFRQTLNGLNPAEVPNLDKAKFNVLRSVEGASARLAVEQGGRRDDRKLSTTAGEAISRVTRSGHQSSNPGRTSGRESRRSRQYSYGGNAGSKRGAISGHRKWNRRFSLNRPGRIRGRAEMSSGFPSLRGKSVQSIGSFGARVPRRKCRGDFVYLIWPLLPI